MRVQFGRGSCPRVGMVDVLVAVQVPPLLRDRVRVVGVGEGDRRSRTAAGRRSGRGRRGPLGGEADLLVEVELVGANAGAGVGHRRHVVVPVRPALGVLPVRGPPVVRGVDVGRQPLLEAVQLVRTDEVHLPGEDGAVAGRRAGSGRRSGSPRRTPRRCRRRACLRRQQPVMKRRPGRRAERAGGVRRCRTPRRPRRARTARVPRHGVAVERQRRRRQLVRTTTRTQDGGLGRPRTHAPGTRCCRCGARRRARRSPSRGRACWRCSSRV